ncbi:hypothetical protein E2C01_079166 [Portunus trituberculatus]|uniref:Uncharacterized protein n=1 Tax=Portunus trituberculatus TaxID=210409 RepID=A0A5B7ISK4_PORTR|nr:hypothetical protein [Portunus trituberculatus]
MRDESGRNPDSGEPPIKQSNTGGLREGSGGMDGELAFLSKILCPDNLSASRRHVETRHVGEAMARVVLQDMDIIGRGAYTSHREDEPQ